VTEVVGFVYIDVHPVELVIRLLSEELLLPHVASEQAPTVVRSFTGY
jgi:hypothetical protein